MVAHVLTFCDVCDKWIAHESTHSCVMSPDYRAKRLEDRAMKLTGLRARGVSILIDKGDEL